MCRLIFSRGQPPFRVLLACGRSCCYGLSHFLQLTFPCWHSRVCFSFHKFHFMLHTAIANRTQELAFIRSFRFIPLISLSGYMFFSHPTNPCVCSRVPFHSTPLHHHTHTPFPFIRSNTLHSLITSSPCFFQR
jgi:hypothetical protein